jgi:hypothetical protein
MELATYCGLYCDLCALRSGLCRHSLPTPESGECHR